MGDARDWSKDMEMRVFWSGPHAWPGFERQGEPASLPSHSGVYLWTFEYQDGYLIYGAGLTRRLFRQRFREHTRLYLSGDYTVLDVAQLKNGVRSEIWHGWGWNAAKRAEFAERQSEIEEAARRQLAAFRVFVTEVDPQARVSERLEAAIMSCLYAAPAPFCTVPDRGMMLAPKRDSEEAIFVWNSCESKLHGLPAQLSI
jgi:hypothetical protein